MLRQNNSVSLLLSLSVSFPYISSPSLLLLQVVVQVKPVYTPPQLFPIGKETITYIASDRSGNQANCSFTVTVIGELILSGDCIKVNYGSCYIWPAWLVPERKRERWKRICSQIFTSIVSFSPSKQQLVLSE